MLMLAMTIHNLPEGAACGAVFAGVLAGEETVSLAGAMVLALGIAIQNFPEGAVVSLPLRGEGKSRAYAFCVGILSGMVELMGAILALLLTAVIEAALPYLLSFAAGTMIYVVTEELLPDREPCSGGKLKTVAFALGFALMMVLDVALA